MDAGNPDGILYFAAGGIHVYFDWKLFNDHTQYESEQ